MSSALLQGLGPLQQDMSSRVRKNYVLPKKMFIIVKFVSGMGSNVGHSQKTKES